MSSALAMDTGEAFVPPSDQSRPKYEAAHWRYTHGVAHKKLDAAAGCVGAADALVNVCERVSRLSAALMHARAPI